MVISEERETIFIHVPKCAGTSVKSVLMGWGFERRVTDVQADDIDSGFYLRGTAARMHRRIAPALWARSFKFAVCRNPYDRLFSGWNYVRKTVRVDVPFEYFVRHLNTFRGYWTYWHCVMPQLQHLLLDGACVADHICRFENLAEDFEVVRLRLGEPALRLPHLNATVHAPYRTQYTKEMQDRTFEIFAGDFEYFGYEYDL